MTRPNIYIHLEKDICIGKFNDLPLSHLKFPKQFLMLSLFFQSILEEVMSENVTDIDAIFRLVHVTKNFNISLQALFFLFHFTEHQPQLRDRYYQVGYTLSLIFCLSFVCEFPAKTFTLFPPLSVSAMIKIYGFLV